MAELKTRQTKRSVAAFIKSVDAKRRDDCLIVLELMKQITGEEAIMWGPSIVGFGSVHLKYASGRELDWFLTGFSPRKQSLTLYIMSGFDKYEGLLKKLGKYKTAVSCLYVNKLSDVHMPTLKKLVAQSVADMKKQRQ